MITMEIILKIEQCWLIGNYHSELRSNVLLAATHSSLMGPYMYSQLWVHLKQVGRINTYWVKLTVCQDTLRKANVSICVGVSILLKEFLLSDICWSAWIFFFHILPIGCGNIFPSMSTTGCKGHQKGSCFEILLTKNMCDKNTQW